jgi:hypothetical protein
MNWMKFGFISGLLILIIGTRSPAQAPSPEARAAVKPATSPEQATFGKASPAEVFRSKAEAATAELCQCEGEADSAVRRKIEQALSAPLHSPGLSFADAPLQAVVEALQAEYRIPIRLDKPALEDAGIGPDLPVTFKIHDISLRSALKHLLRGLQMKYIIKDEVLLFTTQEAAEKELISCIYSIQGLVDDTDPQSVKSLIEVIQSCVSTETWAVNKGGQAEVRALHPGLLVVTQTPTVQEEVSNLLMKIRKMREQVPIVKARPRAPEPAPSHSSSGTPEKKQ